MFFDKDTLQIIDDRKTDDKIFYGEPFSVCYTKIDEDITTAVKKGSSPYVGNYESFSLKGERLFANDTKSTLCFENIDGGVIFHLDSTSSELSEYGLYLPFNFMGKKGGGGWQNQFLFNSPYMSHNKEIMYAYLTKPNGCNIVVAVLGGLEGWKMEYSPYLGGHYFVGLKILANFDKAYNTKRRKNSLTVAILPVSDFDDCLEKLSKLYNKPFLHYEKNGGKLGDEIKLKPYGKIDLLQLKHKNEVRNIPFNNTIVLDREGEMEITPIFNNASGQTVSVYAYKSLIELYKKSMDSVNLDIIEKHTDGNLCEHQCWASAMLRFLLKYSDLLSIEEKITYENKVKSLLSIIMETDIDKAVKRRTILNKPYNNYPAYNIFCSKRIQEEFFGITILLDAYKYFKEKEYYAYATNTMDSFLATYLKEDGRIQTTNWKGEFEDYTTVCCPMIPILDMANFLIGKDEVRSKKYFSCAKRIAEYLYNRGLVFPTEGGKTSLADSEMEDGSISCTALSLLYYCKNAERNELYIKKAKEILDLHESWLIKTPICQMNCSSLRWWETQWEGDADGPALCCGHAWTIWRSEADWLYYFLTKDEEYNIKAFNGVMTNLSKIDEQGKSFAIYNPDLINGGGFKSKAEDVVFRVANRFPDTQDCGLSRYVWIRLNDMYLEEKSN